jgi:single-strand DNA-binding protein
MLNKVMLIGNLGRDPEVRSIPSGQQVATFTLATNRRWTDKAGQRQEQTEWHQVVCWGKLAEIAAQYLTKGKQIFVEGRIQTRSWDDKQTGEKKYRTEVICENFQMLGQRGGGPEMEGHAPAPGGPTYDEGLGARGAPEDDDIPF